MADPSARTFWHWPDQRHFCYFLFLGAIVGLWFELIYGGADWVASQHTYRVRVHLDADMEIPFIPASVLGYMALYPLLWAPPFILRTRREMQALAATLIGVILVAGACFLIFPAASAFPPGEESGVWDGLIRFARWVARTNNFMPSLHVAISVVCVNAYALSAARVGKILLWLWAAMIAASTLLLHQHYLLDVVTGVLLGLAGVRWIYQRWVPAREKKSTK